MTKRSPQSKDDRLIREIARYLAHNPGDGRQRLAEIKKRWPHARDDQITRAFGVVTLVGATVLAEKVRKP